MIVVDHLSKKYGDFLAVDDLSFTIEDGHIYGLLGPNGAGKSTTMNIMTGCLSATQGEVTIDGHNIFEESTLAKKKIGYLPELPPLYLDETPEEYLKFVAEAKGVDKKEIANEINRVISETHIEDVRDRLNKHLSKGYRQRVGIAQALLGNPEVIILDEPTVGLDPLQIIEIRDLISELGKKHTVILSSHILSEVQNICEKILIIAKGRLVAFDTMENLQKQMEGSSLILRCSCKSKKAEEILSEIKGVDKIETLSEEGKECRLQLTCKKDPDKLSAEIFKAFAANEVILYEMSKEKASLEKLFIELTESEEKADDSSI